MNETDDLDREPRWPALVALLATGGLYAALPTDLALIPYGGLLVIILLMMVQALISLTVIVLLAAHAVNRL